MKRSYNLEGLDCANCAAKMERKISAIKGVSESSVDFFNQRAVVEFEDGLSDVDEQVEKAVKKIDSHVKVSVR